VNTSDRKDRRGGKPLDYTFCDLSYLSDIYGKGHKGQAPWLRIGSIVWLVWNYILSWSLAASRPPLVLLYLLTAASYASTKSVAAFFTQEGISLETLCTASAETTCHTPRNLWLLACIYVSRRKTGQDPVFLRDTESVLPPEAVLSMNHIHLPMCSRGACPLGDPCGRWYSRYPSYIFITIAPCPEKPCIFLTERKNTSFLKKCNIQYGDVNDPPIGREGHNALYCMGERK
jgi:hypothetical protein